MLSQKGQSLAELTVVVALIGSVTLVSTAAIDSVKRTMALTAATSEMRANFMYVRSLAIAHDRNVAIRFRDEGSVWTWAVYEDGDGDGVRNADISTGIDRELMPPKKLQIAPARIGYPNTPIPDPFAEGTLDKRPAIRFGAPMLCSFGRKGEATNGSIVLTDGKHVSVLRIQGTAARINVYRWNGKKWRMGV